MSATNQQLAKTEKGQVQQVERTRDRILNAPDVDILEMADEVIVRADLPGVDEKNVDVTLENGVLTIQGRAEDEVPEELRLIDGEYVSADYKRVFSLSEEIDQEKIRAKVRNGVLTLHLPKAEPARARRIDVTAE